MRRLDQHLAALALAALAGACAPADPGDAGDLLRAPAGSPSVGGGKGRGMHRLRGIQTQGECRYNRLNRRKMHRARLEFNIPECTIHGVPSRARR